MVNKCDEAKAARRLVASLTASLPLSRPFGDGPPPIVRTSAATGEGIDAFAADILQRLDAGRTDLGNKEVYFFRRWVKQEWGRAGERLLESELGGAEAFLAAAGGFDDGEAAFAGAMKRALAR